MNPRDDVLKPYAVLGRGMKQDSMHSLPKEPNSFCRNGFSSAYYNQIFSTGSGSTISTGSGSTISTVQEERGNLKEDFKDLLSSGLLNTDSVSTTVSSDSVKQEPANFKVWNMWNTPTGLYHPQDQTQRDLPSSQVAGYRNWQVNRSSEDTFDSHSTIYSREMSMSPRTEISDIIEQINTFRQQNQPRYDPRSSQQPGSGNNCDARGSDQDIVNDGVHLCGSQFADRNFCKNGVSTAYIEQDISSAFDDIMTLNNQNDTEQTSYFQEFLPRRGSTGSETTLDSNQGSPHSVCWNTLTAPTSYNNGYNTPVWSGSSSNLAWSDGRTNDQPNGSHMTADVNKLFHAFVVRALQAQLVNSRSPRCLEEGRFCAFCKRNKETPEFYRTHVVKDSRGKVICPVLRKYVCPVCSATGDKAHTLRHCPVRFQNLQLEQQISWSQGRN